MFDPSMFKLLVMLFLIKLFVRIDIFIHAWQYAFIRIRYNVWTIQLVWLIFYVQEKSVYMKYIWTLPGKQNLGEDWIRQSKFGDVVTQKEVTLCWLTKSDMARLEKFGHLQLVYHFKLLSALLENALEVQSYL